MYDPMSVAFEISYPWYRHKPWPKGARRWEDMNPVHQRGRCSRWREGYRDSFITIWHVDPEKDGTDDSCGFCYPKLTDKQKEKIKWLAWAEAHEPWFQQSHCKKINNPIAAETLARAGLLTTARALGIALTLEDATLLAIRLIHHGSDNIRGLLCFIPGYHSNFKEDTPEHREYTACQLFSCFARNILYSKRRWYQFPRWHFWHWKFQIHPWQNFNRWLFPQKDESNAVYQHPEA